MASAFVLIALLFDVHRFYIHGALVFGGWLTAHLLAIEPGLPVAMAGTMVSLIGAILLYRMIAGHPPHTEQMRYVKQETMRLLPNWLPSTASTG